MKYVFDLLKERADEQYADFHAKLVPGIERERILGVRTPVMKALAKELLKDEAFCSNVLPQFMGELPHYYYDEMILHGEIISREKDFDKAIALTEEYLSHIDNWAECDLLDPKVFAKNKAKLFERIKLWLDSSDVYIVRFGIVMLIKYFLDKGFKTSHLDLVRKAKGDDYYIKMAKAWYYSTALVKQYDVTLEYLKTSVDDEWIFKKSIQKARESYRITEDQKQLLKSLSKHV